jgi:hypothetical protein
MTPYQSAPGFWLRCSAFPCSPTHPEHVIARGDAVRDETLLMDILPSDSVVSLYNVTLTVAP